MRAQHTPLQHPAALHAPSPPTVRDRAIAGPRRTQSGRAEFPVGRSTGGAVPQILFRVAAILLLMLATVGATGAAPDTRVRNKAPDNAIVYFIWPADGAVLHGGRFWVRMGLRNMGVAPRGVDLPNVGHHHLLIDADLPALDEPIPSDRNHLHFGAGETEARIELPPGTHTLQLLLGDRDHVPHEPPVMSKKISVTVK